MGTLRTRESDAHYKKLCAEGLLEGGCSLCRARTIREFSYWRIIPNAFPYDRIAKTHHLILPKRHAVEEHLTREEWDEWDRLKKGSVNAQYEYIIEPTLRTKSIPQHCHYHLLVVKDE